MSELVQEEKYEETPLEMEAEMRTLALESARLEVLEKKANLQDVQERLAERELKRESIRERGRINQRTLDQTAGVETQRQRTCTHRKGGNGLSDFLGGRGQDPQYAVLKHTMLNGDTWVRCMRCGKTWKPPAKRSFYFTVTGERTIPERGTFNQTKYGAAMAEWREAVNFQTKNSTSSSYMFRFSDGGEYSREILEATTLR